MKNRQHKIAVFDTRLQPHIQRQIQAMSDVKIFFPSQRALSEAELVRSTGNADIVLVGPWDRVTSSYLDACPAIKYVGLCGTSTANIDLEELNRRGIAFSNVMSHGKEAVAEFVFMQLVRLVRGVGEYQWKTDQHQLMGLRLGVIGLGHVGQAIAQMAMAYKLDVQYTGPNRKQDWEDLGVKYRTKQVLLQTSDIIVISSPTNTIVIDKEGFSYMGPNSILVQTSAGTPFDKTEFLQWIERDNHYAIFDRSCGDENKKDYQLVPRIIFSEKIAGDTYETDERRGKKVVANLQDYLAKAP